MRKVVEVLVRALVDHPQAVSVTRQDADEATVLKINVDSDDMGKVIGKSGRIVRAIRTVAQAAADGDPGRLDVEVVD